MKHYFKGENLRKLRKSRGITAAELSAKMGFSQSYINHFETDRAVPNVNALGEILKYLGTDIPSFFGDELDSNKRTLLNTISQLSEEQIVLLTELLQSFNSSQK